MLEVLKHKLKGITFDDMLICLCIKDKHCLSQNNLQNFDFQANIHLVESSSKLKSKLFKCNGPNKNKFDEKKTSF